MALTGVLGHLANLGQFVEIGQGHAHQREQIAWSRRNYRVDLQALKIELLGAARDDVRGTYDTYIERLDTLLLLNALLLPFALNTLQFSGEFLPKTEEECGDCVEVEHPWICTVWVYLVALSVIMPFWSLLMLLRCKMRLDNWLQHAFGQLQVLRRDVMLQPAASALPREGAAGSDGADGGAETGDMVLRCSAFIVGCQDLFSAFWARQCAPLVFYATRLLVISTTVAVTLTGLMVWIFLKNRRGHQRSDHVHFMVLMVIGLLAPAAWFFCRTCCGRDMPVTAGDRSAVPATCRTSQAQTLSAPLCADRRPDED